MSDPTAPTGDTPTDDTSTHSAPSDGDPTPEGTPVPAASAETAPANDTQEIIDLLQGELIQAKLHSRQSFRMVALIVTLVGAYLLWTGNQLSKMLDPVGVAEAATGAAIEAVPAAGDNLRLMVVEGAPDLARAGSQAVVDLIPTYRGVLEEELGPVVDEVCTILAQAAVHSMVESAGKAKPEAATRQALQDGANAVVARLDTVLEQALDEPTEHNGPSPRETIEQSLGKLQRIDAGLKRLAAGRGDPRERELVLTWISLLQQFDSEAEAAAIQAHKSGERVSD